MGFNEIFGKSMTKICPLAKNQHPTVIWGGVGLSLNKNIFGYGTVAKRTRCTFCDFRVKAIGYKK